MIVMRILDVVDENTWWDILGKCDYATFFHTPLWHRLAERTFRGCRDVSVGAELPNGVRVVLPLLERKRSALGVFSEVVSTFAGCYGGLVADGPVGASDRLRLYQAAAVRGSGRMLLSGNPFADSECQLHGFAVDHDFTHVLDLDSGFDAMFSGFSKGHRSSTQKGRRLGVTTRAARSLDDYRGYYLAYLDSLRRWGERATSRYPWRLFENGFRLAQQRPEQMVLWLAEIEGEVAGGAWVFYWGQHAAYWHGAEYSGRRSTGAINVLLADVIEDACERGVRYFDFGPSGGHEGVDAFKRRFGTKRRRFWRARSQRVVLKPLSTLRRLLAAVG